MALKDELLLGLMKRVDTSSEVTVLADVILIWHAVLGRFSPLIGPSSVQVLFMRSLAANRAAFPWLPRHNQHHAAATPFSAFEAMLKTQPPDEVIRSTQALLGTYIDSLFTLIGRTLTAQFLGSAFRDVDDEKK
jgi:hypothetical protein